MRELLLTCAHARHPYSVARPWIPGSDQFIYFPHTRYMGDTDLTHGVGVETIEIFHDAGYLPLQFKLMTFLEVQAGCINDGK